MKRSIYTCNVCRVEWTRDDDAKRDLLGVRWKTLVGGGDGIEPLVLHPHEAETHVCRRCLEQLCSLARVAGLDR